ncbi:glycosyltransferase [Clavibacter sp. MX14-G9D]|uniref:glycosyltransferase family 2 protein n=1 Tax=Clavibacter sp. MX14-G9D TaxID=3064656 RepID=UPI00293ECF3B|nr:glycosyltransferase [Clavibacter sp. MX14-G9D]
MRSPLPRVGVVILSQGRRPEGLAASLASVLRQRDVLTDVVVVGNGWDPVGLPDGVRGLHLPVNLGIPAGRNAGVPEVSGETLFFLDDDETVPSATFLTDCRALMARMPDVALIQPRIVDPTGAATPRRWIPRIRKGDPARSSAVMSVLEGAVVVRRDAFEAAGGWAGAFFYAHEGIELAWRVWDQGMRAWYAGDLVAHHPAVAPTRHAEYHRLNARNRVWLARRNLPLPLVPVYVGSWTAVQLLRSMRGRDGLGTWLRGWREGWTTSPGPRRPMSWGTVLRMTRAGRPPVI